MKLVYGTNVWSHHQIPVATELAKILGPEQFKMAVFEEVSNERRMMGWVEKENRTWMIGPPRNAAEKERLFKVCLDVDVMIWGACPHEIIQARVEAKKLSLVAAERLLKKPYHHLRMVNPRYAKGISQYRALVNHPHVHALTIGHYAPDDLRTIGAFADRIWRWGYFIDTPDTLPVSPPERSLKLLWAGRMLDWKRVDLLLKALARIMDAGIIGECTIVGDGPERQRLMNLMRRLHLDQDLVRFLPFVPFHEVRRLMREADVYVLTSNRHEGWGAVAGETMAEGCVLVANKAAGAAQDLVRDGETGLLFCDGDVEQLAGQLRRLALDYPLRMQMRKQAWDQMQNIWHPRVAAERLVALCSGLLGSCEIPTFAKGPCSKSGVIELEEKK